jgi:hypothetical protein
MKNKYYDPHFLALLGVGLALGQALSGRPAPRGLIGRKLGRAALSATIAVVTVFMGLAHLEPGGASGPGMLGFFLVNAYVLTALYLVGLELGAPAANLMRRWIEPGEDRTH